MATDLPRKPGTAYAYRSMNGHMRRVGYEVAHDFWKSGTQIYTKDGTGTRAERAARPWEPAEPRTA